MTIACPGPVATGSEAAPRNVFSSTGLVQKHEQRGGSGKRMEARRVGELIARATYHKVRGSTRVATAVVRHASSASSN